jgi:hypothetical protein
MRRTESGGALFAFVTLLLVAPLLWFRDLPLYDLPNHLAREAILFGGVPGAAQYYAAHWRLVPNMAMEGWVAVFRYVVPVEWAVRLFLAAAAAQLFWGAVALNRALFGRRSRFALAAALFVYSGPFLFGFANLCFGLGIALWTVAAWITWREKAWALPLFAVLSCLILLSHLFAFALYALVLVAFEAGELRHGLKALKRELTALAHLLVPAVLWFFAMPHETVAGGVAYAPWLQKFAAVSSAIGFFNPEFDALCLLALLLALAFGIRRIHLAREMTLPLLALSVAYVVLPHQWGQGTFVDYRVPAALALFLCASLGWRESERRRRNWGELAVLAFFLFRTGVMVAQWQSWQADYAQYRAIFAALPEGAKLLPLSRDPNEIDPSAHPPLGHVDALAVVERGALVPDLFAGLGHELLVYRPPYDKLATQTPDAALAPDFDYVLLIRPAEITLAAIPPYAELARGRTFIMGKLAR